jgi:hypothetical protein
MTSIIPSLTSSSSNWKVDDDLLSEASSHSEAAQVYQTWQSEDEDMMSNPGVVSDEEDDVFMQIEDDEGLLPSGLDDFYDTIAQTMSSDDSIGMMLLSSRDAAFDVPSIITSHNNAFSALPSMEDDRSTRFQATLSKLSESMRRSQESRRSLYARTPGLKDYKRLDSVERVLQSVEFSSHHIESYVKAVKQ